MVLAGYGNPLTGSYNEFSGKVFRGRFRIDSRLPACPQFQRRKRNPSRIRSRIVASILDIARQRRVRRCRQFLAIGQRWRRLIVSDVVVKRDTSGKRVIELIEVYRHTDYSPFPQSRGYMVAQRWQGSNGLEFQNDPYTNRADAEKAFGAAVQQAKR